MTDAVDVEAALERMAAELRTHLDSNARSPVSLVGVRTGGVWVAERLASLLGISEELGTLNINFYRDDFTRIGMHPRVLPSSLPFAVDDRHIVLVDDVLYTGRTVRAAMNEIFDYGRPASITLAVLVERDGREIPIQADVTGVSIALGHDETVKLVGPDPLTLEVRAAR